jgi:predicted ATP-dependent endonuclease of OLD family
VKLISGIKISNFRSLKEIDIKGFKDFNVLAGPNNSGKSNFLRALNAFFNNRTDTDSYINVDNDFHKSEKPYKKKKLINIAVTFQKPENFRFRKDLEHLNGMFIDNKVKISKSWERQEFYPTYFLNDQPQALNSDDETKVDQFLSLITFRYIPNRVLPLDLIREEHEALRNALVRRFGIKKENKLKEVFSAIKESSSKLIKKMARDFKRTFPNSNVLLKTPETWAEMVFALGYRIAENQIEFDDTLQGSGIQSLLMFNTLSLIDRDYFQQFGWRQAAIWGVEEPESSLHTNLEAYLLLSAINRLTYCGAYAIDIAWKKSMPAPYHQVPKNIFAN